MQQEIYRQLRPKFDAALKIIFNARDEMRDLASGLMIELVGGDDFQY